MRNTEEIILNVFRINSSRELNTEYLAKEIYPQEYALIEGLINNPDKIKMHEGKHRKFQTHRKLLYYINKLIDSNILKVSKIADKGEKYFSLNTTEGETVIEKGYKKIIITKPVIAETYIEKYELKELMKKFEEDSWIHKFNSILLECSRISDIEKLHNILSECLNNVNDVIALNEFEIIINSTKIEELKEFIINTSKDGMNSNKNICLIIDIASASGSLQTFVTEYTRMNPRKINIVFNVSNRDIQKHSKIIEQIFEDFSNAKIKINFKNNDIITAPQFKGRAGIYNFDEKEWGIYQKKVLGSVIGISCSQSQIAINLTKFFENYKNRNEFREAILYAAKTLLIANTLQRRKSNEYFRGINNLNHPHATDFYKFSRNYIRFWNYDWYKDQKEDNLFELIKSAKELVDNFCLSEETIFKSCGVPIRFKIAFSSAFKNFDVKFMGEREYKKCTVNKSEDYYSGEIKQFIEAREKLFEIFDGGDRLRIFRKSDFSQKDIMHELGILLNAYKIPFFTYDFSGLKGTVKLTNFM